MFMRDIGLKFSFTCCWSVTQLCLNLCNIMDCCTLGFLVLHHLPEMFKLMSIESVMPSNHLVLCRPLLLLPSIFPSIKVFSNMSALCIRWPKYWSFNISLSNEYSALISFRIDWFIPGDSQESSPTPQFKNISSLALSLLYGPTLTPVHDCWKTIALNMQAFVSKVMSLLFNLLDFTFTTRHIHNWASFSLWSSLFILSGAISLLFPSSILEKAMETHSNTLTWQIPWIEEPGRLQSMGLLGVGHDWATSLSLFTFMHWRRKWQPTPVFLPGES